jgi:hypothetical protein
MTYEPVTGETCGWLIEVASGNPEPDFPEDLYRTVECGRPIEANEFGSWRCDAGHEHISHEDPARRGWEAELAHAERYADEHPF